MDNINPPNQPSLPNQPPANAPNLQAPSIPQVAYVPIAVPAQNPAHVGRMYGYIGIFCAIISLLFIPILFGTTGIILGVVSKNKGEKTLGTIAIILSVVFMITGTILNLWLYSLNKGQGFILGPVVYLL